jgi:hypothetical protein
MFRRDRVARQMDDLDLEGVVHGKREHITTVTAQAMRRPRTVAKASGIRDSPDR